MTEPKPTNEPDGEALPFDPRTVLLSLWSRWPWLLAIGVLGVVLGVAAALQLGVKVFHAQTVLLYRPSTTSPTGIAPLSLSNQRDMVQLVSNLERARDRLGEELTLRRLHSATSASVRRDSQMLSITAASRDPLQAADMANALRDAFLEGQREVRRAQLADRIREVEQRRAGAWKERNDSRRRLEQFQEEQALLDPSSLIEQRKERLRQLDGLQRDAETQIASSRAQLGSMEEILAEVEQLGEGPAGARFAGLTPEQLRMRLNLVQSEIDEDLAYRTNLRILAEMEREVERTASLFKAGIVAQEALDTAESARDSQKLLTEETEQIRGLKGELRQIQDALLESAGAEGEAAAGGFRERSVNIRLEQAVLREKIGLIQEERSELERSIAALTPVEREYQDLATDLEVRELELRQLDALLVAARQEHESPPAEFTILSLARPPDEATESNRKFLAIATAGLVGILGLGLILAVEAFSVLKHVRSIGELTLKVPLRPLGALPAVEPDEVLPADGSDGPLVDPAQRIARRIRHAVPQKGARVLITSPGEGAGRTTVAVHVARALASQGDRVALVDADTRSEEGRRTLQGLLAASDSEAGRAAWADMVGKAVPTRWPRLSLLPPSNEPPVGGTRHAELLAELSAEHDVVVLDGPPVLRGVDAERLAEQVDAIVVVARAGLTTGKKLKSAVERLETYQLPIVGAILNDVEPLFLDED